MLTPLVLDPTPPEWVNDDPASHPLDPGPARDEALRRIRWWGTLPDRVAHTCGRAGRSMFVPYLTDPSRQGRDLWHEAWLASGKDPRAAHGENYYRNLLRLGVDPTILLALRGTGLRHADRLTLAFCGLTPAEAYETAVSGTVDRRGASALAALRRKH